MVMDLALTSDSSVGDRWAWIYVLPTGHIVHVLFIWSWYAWYSGLVLKIYPVVNSNHTVNIVHSMLKQFIFLVALMRPIRSLVIPCLSCCSLCQFQYLFGTASSTCRPDTERFRWLNEGHWFTLQPATSSWTPHKYQRYHWYKHCHIQLQWGSLPHVLRFGYWWRKHKYSYRGAKGLVAARP